MLHSRELFGVYKQAGKIALTDIQRAAQFYSLQRMAFGGKVSGQSFGYARTAKAGLSSSRFKRDIGMLTGRLNGVYIENSNWLDCIKRYDGINTLVFCDPPYWNTAGYGIEFDFENYEKMADMMHSMKGRMIVTVNDIPEMRECFAGFSIERLEITYTLGKVENGERPNKSYELLIKNF